MTFRADERPAKDGCAVEKRVCNEVGAQDKDHSAASKGESHMLSPKSKCVYTCFKASMLIIGVLLTGLVCLQHARALDERVDQADVELLVSPIA